MDTCSERKGKKIPLAREQTYFMKNFPGKKIWRGKKINAKIFGKKIGEKINFGARKNFLGRKKNFSRKTDVKSGILVENWGWGA